MRVVVANGVEIPESLVAQEVQNHAGATAAEAWNAAAQALAIKALLLHRAAELGLSAAPELDVAGREETPEEALVRQVLEAEVEPTEPTERECRRVYATRAARFRRPELYAASHILIAPAGTDPDSLEAARVAAEHLRCRIAAGEADFAEAAGRFSSCPSAAVGGALGQLQSGDLAPEIERALLALAEGEIGPAPVRSRFGWHVVRLDQFIAGAPLPFEAVQDRIRLSLQAQAWTTAATRYVAGLAEAAQARGVAIAIRADGGVGGGSLVLGDFLREDGPAAAVAAWLDAHDRDLGRRLASAAAASGVSAQAFARQSVELFVADADDERWTRLISTAQDAADPALAALAQILRSRLAPAAPRHTVVRRVHTR
jgi:peptidyl-prolyl cis-trans isomerase C